MDILENPDNTVTALFELPGLKKEDVNIEVHNNRLTISGKSQSSPEQKDSESKYVVRERHIGQFSRTIPLPQGIEVSGLAAPSIGIYLTVDIQVDKIKATSSDGVLSVTFPKSSPKPAAKRIMIS